MKGMGRLLPLPGAIGKNDEDILANLLILPREWDDFEGVYKCGNRMSWYVKKV